MTGDVVLSVDDLTIGTARRGTVTPLVREVSWELRRGETLGLVGESGSGKSLTLRTVAGLLPPGVEQLGGSVTVDIDGAGLRPSTGSLLGTGIAMVFQEPMTSLNPTMRVGDLITVGPKKSGRLARNDARGRALSLLREVGVPDPERRLDAWPHELSGGLRQRVMIAMALATNPEILLCDEPTTALDVSVQDQILRLLASLKESHHLSVVLVTHDLAVVGQVCDRVVVMRDGRVVETGPTADILRAPTQPYTRQLIEAAS